MSDIQARDLVALTAHLQNVYGQKVVHVPRAVAPLPEAIPKAAPKAYIPPVTIHHPSSFDVLFGRGKTIREHPGNQVLDKIILTHYSKYEAISKERRGEMLEEIVRLMKSTGTRFMKRDDSGYSWKEVDDETAKDKVSHCFRSRRRKLDHQSSRVEKDRSNATSQSQGKEASQPAKQRGTELQEKKEQDGCDALLALACHPDAA